MSKVTGVVSKIFERDTKFGKSYRLAIDTGKGDDEWFGHGFKAPACEEGQTIEFTTKSRTAKNGQVYVDVDGSVTVVQAARAVAQNTGGASPAFIAGGDRQASIVVQSSLKSAIETVGIALNNGALTLGSGKAAAKWDTLRGAIDELTREYAQMALEPSTFLSAEELDEDEDLADEDWNPVE
jgi:hypothetical protein